MCCGYQDGIGDILTSTFSAIYLFINSIKNKQLYNNF